VWTHGYLTYQAAVQYVSGPYAEMSPRVSQRQNKTRAQRAGGGSAETGGGDPRNLDGGFDLGMLALGLGPSTLLLLYSIIGVTC
jgi:hypothetical protein